MAAPQVAGAAALVKSTNPDYNANQEEAALKRAASVPEGYDKKYYGAGFPNILNALQNRALSFSQAAASIAETYVAFSCTPTHRSTGSPSANR